MEGFYSLTEFSIALAGFSGIVIVIVHRDSEWDSFDKFRMQNVLITSLGAAFLSAIPVGLIYLEIQESTTWVIESLSISGFMIFFYISLFSRIRNNLSKSGKKQLPAIPIIILSFIGLILIVLFILSLIGVSGINLKGLSFFSILYLLGLSVFAFSQLVFYRPKQDV